jgi:glutamyl/glutaminyl-tRNA synthetase
LSKRHGASSLADLRDEGIPPEAVRAYLEELGLPKHDVHLDLSRLRRLSIEALAALSDEELAERVGVPVSVAPVLRGARDLREAREYAQQVLEPERVEVDAPETLQRFRELVESGVDARGVVRELKAVGGNLKAVRLALTGRERGPELWAVIAALPRDELLRRSV